MDEVKDVVVVGGGISGLTAAHRLAEKGLSFALLEASPRLGGVISTATVDGFLLEGGPDSLLAQKADGIALCKELGLGSRLVPTNPDERAVYVLHERRLHRLPEGMVLAVPTRIGPFLRSGLFTWAGKLRMGLDLVRPGRREKGDESIASFLRRRFGQQAVDRLGEPLLAGIHAGDPERLSIRASFPRFADLETRYGSLIRGLLSAAPPSKAGGSAFYSLAGGLGELVAALESRLLGSTAGRLYKDAEVIALSRSDGHFAVAAHGSLELRARSVILALPPHRSAHLLRAISPALSSSLAEIRYANTATVCLGYRRDQVAHPLNGYGLIVPRSEGLRTTALGFFSTKFQGRAPAGHVLLRGFVGGARDPEVLEQDDPTLVAIVEKEMAPVLGIRGPSVVSRVFRWPSGTPQLEVGHLDRVATMEVLIQEMPGLFVTGAGFRVTGIPDCVADGTAAAAGAAQFVAASA